jgi:hypothetical protein
MATPSKIHLSPTQQPVFYTELKEESAKKTAELLQENHHKHDIFMSDYGYHVRYFNFTNKYGVAIPDRSSRIT